MSKTARSIINKGQKKRKTINREWYSLRSLLGNDWAIFYLLLGGREAGKSYATTEFFVRQFELYGRPFYWLRLTEASQRKLLNNNAEKLIDPDIRREWNLELETNGDSVYKVIRWDEEQEQKDGTVKIIEHKKLKFMCRVMALSTFYNDKGSGLFDKDFLNDPNMYYNICLDEMNREKNEKKSFDIVYAFTNQLENLVRSTKQRLRVICIGNTLEEASDILCSFNYIPESFGRFKLRKKRCVIDYIEPSDKYLERRKGTIADILMPTASTFTNSIDTDDTLIYSGRLSKPTAVIKFAKDKDKWFTLWDDKVIAKYNNEHVQTLAMRPYLDDLYNVEIQKTIITRFDCRQFCYKNLITFKLFQKELTLLKPRKS
ncbi:MAG: hypothetical protein KBT27_00965 [Prevotellaceae bacterium]|nr:hypothetical protein [Candidatus Faecinaster equi]